MENASGLMWCELKLSPHKIQYYNSITSLAIVFATWLLQRRKNIPLLFLIGGYLSGIGSTLFHMYPVTITRITDEAGLLVLQCGLLHHGLKIQRLWVLLMLGIGCCILIFFPDCTPVFLFSTTWIAVALNQTNTLISRKTKEIFLLATVTWVLDFFLCSNILGGLTWHALWHILAAWGLYVGVRDLVAASNIIKN